MSNSISPALVVKIIDKAVSAVYNCIQGAEDTDSINQNVTETYPKPGCMLKTIPWQVEKGSDSALSIIEKA